MTQLQENDPRLILTPYEKNLDIWRQLWRVIERSDVICQIVDARNPLLFKCDDLAAYVKEMDSSKQNLVLINKADFLTEHQRIYWTEYFDKRATEVAFWSALNETEKHPGTQWIQRDLEHPLKCQTSREKEIQENKMSEMLQIKMNLNDNENKSSNAEVLSPESHVNETDNEADSKHLSVTTATKLVWDEETESLDQTNSVCGTSETCERFIGTTENLPSIPCNDSDHNENGPEDLEEYPNTPIQNSPKMLSKTELIDLLRSRRISNEENGSKSITIGLVGYPNVGKSSTINALLADKKTSVSATPGKTKHFQTLLTDDGLCLCDCPGLVFPTFVSTKAEMVIGGILPIDEMRDYVPPVNLLTKLIPRHVLEHVYGINIPSPREGENPGRPPTADEFLSVYASMRGFMSSHGSPDCSRASRYVLKDFVNGKLLYCQPPPGVEVDDFLPCYTATKIPARNQKEEKYSQKRQKTILNKVDKEFFSQADATPNYKVPSGLKAAGLTSTIHEPIGKPWKKHYNRNKKEKLRRLSKP